MVPYEGTLGDGAEHNSEFSYLGREGNGVIYSPSPMDH